MRTVSRAELPENCHNAVLIKSGERKRQRRLSNALEKTLRRCREIHAEQNKHTAEVRKRSEREGFSAGFNFFFNMLLELLNAYEALQKERQAAQRQQLLDVINRALHDPIIVEQIVTHLHEHCDNNSEITLILPTGMMAPPAFPHLTCLATNEAQITLQCGMRALRFPIDALCHQWVAQTECDTEHINQKMKALIPDTLNRIAKELQRYEQYPMDEYDEEKS